MWRLAVTIKRVYIQKYNMAWTSIEMPLVYIFPNSMHLVLEGNWNSSPGDNIMNNAAAITDGAQSVLIIYASSIFFLL